MTKSRRETTMTNHRLKLALNLIRESERLALFEDIGNISFLAGLGDLFPVFKDGVLSAKRNAAGPDSEVIDSEVLTWSGLLQQVSSNTEPRLVGYVAYLNGVPVFAASDKDYGAGYRKNCNYAMSWPNLLRAIGVPEIVGNNDTDIAKGDRGSILKVAGYIETVSKLIGCPFGTVGVGRYSNTGVDPAVIVRGYYMRAKADVMTASAGIAVGVNVLQNVNKMLKAIPGITNLKWTIKGITADKNRAALQNMRGQNKAGTIPLPSDKDYSAFIKNQQQAIYSRLKQFKVNRLLSASPSIGDNPESLRNPEIMRQAITKSGIIQAMAFTIGEFKYIVKKVEPTSGSSWNKLPAAVAAGKINSSFNVEVEVEKGQQDKIYDMRVKAKDALKAQYGPDFNAVPDEVYSKVNDHVPPTRVTFAVTFSFDPTKPGSNIDIAISEYQAKDW